MPTTCPKALRPAADMSSGSLQVAEDAGAAATSDAVAVIARIALRSQV